MDDIIKIDSITDLHEYSGYDKPTHPLVTIIDVTKIKPLQEIKDARVRLGFYCISMKSDVEEGMKYGRQFYDFKEGSLIFIEPNQVATFDIAPPNEDATGWMLCIHPEFIRGSELAKKIDKYHFFSYTANEALHLSDQEKMTLNNIIETIQNEVSQNIDVYTRKLILNSIELLLNFSERFYNRQFLTRTTTNNDTISEFEAVIKDRFNTDRLENEGIPTVKELATTLGYSPYYLSDLLKKETGKSTQDYIHEYLLQRAKDLLISTNDPVSQIGYQLGFEYPAHFSKFFKKKTGVTPSNYRVN
ncbi:helix-turn-helix domain-containing protein [Acidaminobacter sp. JC074]|uniref:helix-turn-helix domain-containing protein n=1 Tax=Acidaminobacter sp. JC074 TaxID=2530199 RepID=UPI001F0D48AE|nr:helix-turn-helix transcriptional regulator [Acidaminobacter sp. JC074]MCH4887665.1 helix-turn-helix domain-containing protein [Acidaminobacter sp. JC074]